MHIHSVIVSYKRKELTEKTLQSYLDTVSVPHSIVIVDNNSPPDTTEWLSSLDIPVIFLKTNKYPGYATNRGWEKMPNETVLLHRIDNDTQLLPGWCENAIEAFENTSIGQYGLLAEGGLDWLQSKNLYPSAWRGWPIGGASIIHRKLYDRGLRYSEKPWTDGGNLEDTQMTLDVWKLGYGRVFSTIPVMEYLGGRYPEYDMEIKKSRGLWTREDERYFKETGKLK